jgi:succinate-semialdehyde dehydrogenase / glutarate-semialdehyde dehydrogenase
VLAAGDAMVFKPSGYTPGVSQWLVDRFAEVVPEQPVLQLVHGLGDTGAALCRSGVDRSRSSAPPHRREGAGRRG